MIAQPVGGFSGSTSCDQSLSRKLRLFQSAERVHLSVLRDGSIRDIGGGCQESVLANALREIDLKRAVGSFVW